MKDQRAKYIAFLFGPFFRWWWALITGLATLLSYKLPPQTGWRLGPAGTLLITLLCFTLLFLALSVGYQGLQLFRAHYGELILRGIQKSRDLGGDWVFIITAGVDLPVGTVIDVHRRLGNVEVPFALVEIVGTNSDGYYQGLPRWLAPVHIRDYTGGKFLLEEAVVLRSITATRIRDLIDSA